MTDPIGERPPNRAPADRPSKRVKSSAAATVLGRPFRDKNSEQQKHHLPTGHGHNDNDHTWQTSRTLGERTTFRGKVSIASPKTIPSKSPVSAIREPDAETEDNKESALNRKLRTPPQISPPPLKRLRSGDVLYTSQNDQVVPSSVAIRSNGTLLQHDGDSTLSVPDKRVGLDLFRTEHGLRSSSFRSSRGLGQEDDAISVTGSSTSSVRGSKCSICRKSSEKQYDKLKKCSSCHRLYHEACRRPSLIEGTDLDLWTCFKCEPNKKMAQRPRLGSGNRADLDLHRSDVQMNKTLPSPAIPPPITSTKFAPGSPSTLIDRRLPSPRLPGPLSNGNEMTASREGKDGEHPKKRTDHVASPSKNSEVQHVTMKSLHAAHSSHPRSDVPVEHVRKVSTSTQTAYDNLVEKARKGGRNVAGDASTAEELQEDELDGLIFDIPVSHTASREQQVSTPSTVPQRQNLITDMPKLIPDPLLVGRSPVALLHGRCEDQRLSMTDEQPGISTGRLCCSCQKTRILAARKDENVICRGCKNHRESVQNDETVTTIPETPQSIAVSPFQSGTKPDTVGTASSAHVQNRAVAAPPATFFQAAALGSKAKIRAKELPLTTVRTSLDRSSSPEKKQIPPIGKGSVTPSREQSQECMRPDSDVDSAIAEMCGPLEADTVADKQATQASQGDLFNGTLPGYTKVSSALEDNRDQPPDAHLGVPNSLDTDATLRRRDALDSRNAIQGSSLVPSTQVRKSKGTYSYKELIVMALLAGDGKPQTVAQLRAWVARTFPQQYPLDETSWQNSISATPYSQDDLRKERISSSKAIHWDFASSKIRDKWAAKFPDLVARQSAESASSASSAMSSPQLAQVKENGSIWHGRRGSSAGDVQTGRKSDNPRVPILGINSGEDQSIAVGLATQPSPLPIDKLQPVRQSIDKLRGLVQQESPSIEALQQAAQYLTNNVNNMEDPKLKSSKAETALDSDDFFMPFEPKHSLQIAGNGVRYEFSFFLAYPEYIVPSIDFMTQTQVDQKREEIKKRPSRKATFGKRLAFARSQRGDVHNEMAGSFQVRHAALKAIESKRKNMDQDQDMRDVDDIQDRIWEAFNVPREPVPLFHEGQLVFRG